MDLHRRRSVLVRMTEDGRRLATHRKRQVKPPLTRLRPFRDDHCSGGPRAEEVPLESASSDGGPFRV